MIAATAVTVTVGKKTAIAGGKGTFSNTCTDYCTVCLPSLCLSGQVCFFLCLCEASCVSLFLDFFSSFHLPYC